MSCIVLDPTNTAVESTFKSAARPEILEGLTLGLIDNGKKNSDYVLKQIAMRLKTLYGIENEIWVKKPSPSHAISQAAADELAHKAHVVVAGIGD